MVKPRLPRCGHIVEIRRGTAGCVDVCPGRSSDAGGEQSARHIGRCCSIDIIGACSCDGRPVKNHVPGAREVRTNHQVRDRSDGPAGDSEGILIHANIRIRSERTRSWVTLEIRWREARGIGRPDAAAPGLEMDVVGHVHKRRITENVGKRIARIAVGIHTGDDA